jgi:predicted nuclease of predicted toxin-antitoxin system
LKLKLDENLGTLTAQMLREAGHDVSTVTEQGMSGASDPSVIEASSRERRCLVTLDLEFGNPLLFRPSRYSGIAVLRLPGRVTSEDIDQAVRTLIGGLQGDNIQGRLWVVQRGRIRQYQEEDDG